MGIPTDGTVTASDATRMHNGPAGLIDCLVTQYPDTDPAVIETIVQGAWDDSSRFRVKDFRMVLVERAVRARLGSLTGETTDGTIAAEAPSHDQSGSHP